MTKAKKILIAPLDWGLGHATRCVPIIEIFLNKNYEVHLASNGRALELLKSTFPTLKYFELPAYNIKYYDKFNSWRLLLQGSKVKRAIKAEHKFIEEIQKIEKYDIIISDNRYGVFHPDILSVLICHQLKILPPQGFRFAKEIIWRMHRSYIYEFDHLWIPDDKQNKLSGQLAHGFNIEIPHTYVGILSRFKKNNETKIKANHFLILLSGPEPLRTQLEMLLLQQAAQLTSYTFTIVRGISESHNNYTKENLQVFDCLVGDALQNEIEIAEAIIARSGYSTLMDLVALEKKAIFIPTPGQTEQEYLAQTLSKQNKCVYMTQNELDIQKAILLLPNILPLNNGNIDMQIHEVLSEF